MSKMEEKVKYTTSLGSVAEEEFIEIFSEIFGPEKTRFLSVQHPFVDIYGRNRFIDFALESEGQRLAIEIDGEDILKSFKNVAHRLDLRKAVELGELCEVRCIRVKTNVDISNVRINGIQYNAQDLENKLYLPERNDLLVKTYLEYVKDKRTVAFCASVKHAEEIAEKFSASGISCQAFSGSTPKKQRDAILNNYRKGAVKVLCACDLLNEGWDSPETEVLFMARPTMSKTIYLQQLGRGMRKFPGKSYLMVFDFIDNASLFNTPHSIHRILNLKEYRPGGLVLAPPSKLNQDWDIYKKGEKPEVILDIPIDVADYEYINLFDWQEEARNMLSQLEFVRMVDVQAETIERYIREDKIKADLTVPFGNNKSFKYFKRETIETYAEQFKWELITPANMKDKFLEMVSKMDMSYSYKPVLLKAFFEHCDRETGKARIEDIVDYFLDYYEDRRSRGLFVEKQGSLYCKEAISRKEAERNIFNNPLKRFADMRFLRRSKTIEDIELNKHILRRLTPQDIEWIITHSDKKLEEYYARFDKENKL